MKYLGVKLIEAGPMTRGAYNTFRGWTIPENENPDDEGYLVKYSDDHISWSPKDVFEKAYFPLTDPEGKALRQQDIENFIVGVEEVQYGDKTTVVHAKLKNGFILSESSSCVEPENFNMEVGKDICLERIANKTWQHLGFLLQCGRKGMNGQC